MKHPIIIFCVAIFLLMPNSKGFSQNKIVEAKVIYEVVLKSGATVALDSIEAMSQLLG
ncbi:MAG: hypothetical protein KKB51_08635 [Candidatus Riflebacteria bacterium]|nr:hypothetical protein [Candidatus Riflebacteria bacterium]